MAHVISKKMLSDALHSVNKRAKNYRDVKRRGVEGAAEKEREMYEKKEILLTLLQPVFIHREPLYETRQVTKDDPFFYDKLLNAIRNDSVLWWSYYRKNKKIIYFFLEKIRMTGYQYYLFYPFMSYSYHLPISEDQLSDYPDLPIRDIKNLATTGADNLLPMEEVDKIIGWIESGDYIFHGEITEEDIERHWNSKELSYEAERRVEEAYNYLNRYVKQGILMRAMRMSLTEEDKDALDNLVYNRMKNKLMKYDDKEKILAKAESFSIYLPGPVIDAELIYSAPEEKTRTTKELIMYWHKKGCFKRQQEIHRKVRKARTYCANRINQIRDDVVNEVLTEKGFEN